MARKKATKTIVTTTEVFEEPQSRNEALLQNILGASNDLGDPQSRNEALLMNILGESYDIGEAQSRIEALLMRIKEQGTGGRITADDLGKVVAETGTDMYELIAQTAHAEITENGTYDTTTNDEVTVNISASGGNSIATGTIYYSSDKYAYSGENITFDLDHDPLGFAWMIIETDSGNLDGNEVQKTIIPEGLAVRTPSVAIDMMISPSPYGHIYYRTDTSQTLWNSAGMTRTGGNLMPNNPNMNIGKIPAGTTIRWFVW